MSVNRIRAGLLSPVWKKGHELAEIFIISTRKNQGGLVGFDL
jgi:hypothetical protein